MKGADWAVNWAVFLGLFVAIEGQALLRRDYEGTLTAHLRQWASIGHKGKWWRARRFTLLSFLAWLVVHLLAPAGTFALLLLAMPAAAESLVMPAEYRQPFTIEVWGDAVVTQDPGPESRLVCVDGAVWEEVTYQGGARTRRTPLLTAAESKHWGACSRFTLAGTAALLLAPTALDGLTTALFCREGIAEANGTIMGDPCANPLQFLSVKAVVAAGQGYGVVKVGKTNPRRARIFRAVLVAVNIGVSGWNVVQIMRARNR